MQTFKSKIDGWLAVVVFTSAGLALVSAGYVLFEPWSVSNSFIALLIFLVGTVLPLWLTMTTRYTVYEEQLVVRSGPFCWRISLNEITDVKETHNPVSSPALSLDRLAVLYGKNKQVLVSPQDKAHFIEAVTQKDAGEKLA